MNLQTVKNIYFLGIGGIGMSALARYFNFEGKHIAGYDRTSSPLTRRLESEGIQIHYDDAVEKIPKDIQLVIYTPAIPTENKEFEYLKTNAIPMMKRSEVLGAISADYFTIAIAGTHGKTTITSMVAHILKYNNIAVNAFIGGIANNYKSNLILSKNAEVMVVEADEFDRSFLSLYPDMAIISSMDADHLDIYSTKEYLKDSFFLFSEQIKTGGWLISQSNLEVAPGFKGKNISYSVKSTADYQVNNIHISQGKTHFTFLKEEEVLNEYSLLMPGIHNIENAMAAIIACSIYGLSQEQIAEGIKSYAGVHRRFEFLIHNDHTILIDDYAHHPTEIKATLQAARSLFPNKKISGVFQPHLYSRTRDFMTDFANSLSMFDELILLDIYPAREKPIEGVTSEVLLDKIKLKHKQLCSKEQLIEQINKDDIEVLIMMGAGDIDRLLTPVKTKLLS